MVCKLNTCDIVRKRVVSGDNIFDFYCTACQKPKGIPIPKDLRERHPPPSRFTFSSHPFSAAAAVDSDDLEP